MCFCSCLFLFFVFFAHSGVLSFVFSVSFLLISQRVPFLYFNLISKKNKNILAEVK